MSYIVLTLKDRLKKLELFEICVIISATLHLAGLAAYYIYNMPGNEKDYVNPVTQDVDLEFIDIPQELIGGDSNPAPVEKKEWIEGTSRDKTADAPADQTDVNKVSGDGTDEEGYLIGYKVDRLPELVIDFDVNNYFPKEARRADITQKTVTVLIKIDETGAVKGAKIVSEPAGYGFDEAAMKVVNRMKFKPGYLKGQPVKMIVKLPILFMLED